jgi:hypothetical protein
MILRVSVLVALALLSALSGTELAGATPITSITDLNNFRDTRSINDVGLGQGDTDQYGAQVVPNDAAGTRVFATQGSVRIPGIGTNACGGFTVNPNQCANSINFNPALTGSWSLTFVNGPDQATAMTPPLAPSAGTKAPFADTVTITGSGTTPTISWTVPPQAGFSADAIRINIFDKTKKNSQNVADIIFSTTVAGDVRTFPIPASANLQEKTPYVFSLQLIETRDHTATTGSPNSNIARRSSSFFDFTALPAGAPPQIVLPTVTPAPDPNSGPIYNFTVREIKAGQAIFIDPLVAIGYKYTIGAGNPNFASVTLPSVGDNLFMLSFLLGQNTILQQIAANTQFFFPQGGVSAFDVMGIETSAGLDPNNVTAFITGLTFVGDGDFTGTMTPLIADGPDAVPEPATLVLLGTTLGALGLVRRARHRSEQGS